MRFALLVALAHLRPNDEAGIRAISVIAVLGVLIGVAALIIVLAVAEGFETEMRRRILLADAHLHTSADAAIPDAGTVAASIAEMPGVTDAAPYRDAELVIQSRSGLTGVLLFGASTDHPDVLARHLDHVQGDVVGDPFSPAGDLPGVLLGIWLAETVGVGVGDTVSIQTTALVGGKRSLFEVTGLLETQQYLFDTKRAIVSLEEAQVLLGPGADGIESYIDDPDDAVSLAAEIDSRLGAPFETEHWMARNEALFHVLQLQKTVMGLIMSLVTLVAGMNIVGFLIIDVVTRTRELAVLQVLGASVRQIRQIFLVQGLIVGATGAALGVTVGLAGCWILHRYPLQLDDEIYLISTLPVAVDPLDTAAVALLAITVALLCTLYPVSIAARADPLDGLRS